MINLIQKAFVKISFYYLSKGLDKLYQEDSEVQKRLAIIPNETKIKLSILGSSQCLVLKKSENGLYKCKDTENCDLSINFKHNKTLPNIVFGTSSVIDCYLMDEFFVCGELKYAVALVYLLECFMGYILPNKLYQKTYKRKAEKSITSCKMFITLLFAKRKSM